MLYERMCSVVDERSFLIQLIVQSLLSRGGTSGGVLLNFPTFRYIIAWSATIRRVEESERTNKSDSFRESCRS